MILEIDGIKKSFGGLVALDGALLEVRNNTIVGLIGPNGSGKTTLLNVISGFLVPEGGSIRFNGMDITGFRPFEIARLGLCRTFQLTRLFRRLTVLENMLLASRTQDDSLGSVFISRKKLALHEKADAKRAADILDFLEIGHLGNEYAGSLSGGQQKLLNLGMMLMSEPGMVLLDEPVAGVNPSLANRIFEKILKEKEHRTFLVVEHNVDVLMNFCDYIFVMNRGRIVASGTPDEIQCDETVIEVYLGG
ncbi:MAG TPA: ABC transporter ATP-binding protein [Candidatus Methanoperedenaceae archaeon]|nr:ABC transporter ATP-binding protein [Candidatus Methanoperedenaceae archaeon]